MLTAHVGFRCRNAPHVYRNWSNARVRDPIVTEHGRPLPRHELFVQRNTKPPVALLPGLYGGAWIWAKTSERLKTANFTVVSLIEPFAMARTSTNVIRELRIHVQTLIHALRFEKWILVGNSLGALVALDFACEFPDQVAALVICGPPGLAHQSPLDPPVFKKVNLEVAYQVVDKLFFNRRCIPENIITEVTSSLISDPAAILRVLRSIRASRSYDIRSALRRVMCDTLVVWGRQDLISPVENGERYLREMKSAELAILDRCGHAPMIESPEEFNARLMEFLNARFRDCEAKERKHPAGVQISG
jgi:2-hydroxy-6-oxonona-2,4-dienedioate hydrolase